MSQKERQDKKEKSEKKKKKKKKTRRPKVNPMVFYVLVFAGILMAQFLFFSGPAGKELTYQEFKSKVKKDQVKNIVISDQKIRGSFVTENDTTEKEVEDISLQEPGLKESPKSFYIIRVEDDNIVEFLEKHHADYKGIVETDWWSTILTWGIPILLIVLLWSFLARRMGSMGNQMMQIGKSKAKVAEQSKESKKTFDDVAGVEEAVDEVQEVVDFLMKPEKFTQLGGRLPKGILLVGPPGTGKTLLARAVAGEAEVPFFHLDGSDFMEMFVGVGASRVRDLFKEARKKAPCIIFIDELDAIGKKRAASAHVGGQGERENTLNEILSEIDGFDPQSGIVVMAATNRPDVLDPALLRPGRFDRQIVVGKPDKNGRKEIFKVHLRDKKVRDDIDLDKLASRTPGFAGADIENVCNEAAILAARNDRKKIEMEDFDEAIQRSISGLKKKSKVIIEQERKLIAYHETGHALVGYFTDGADEVQKISIVPRGRGALGFTMNLPLEDRNLMSKTELLGKLKGLLGGRAAEKVVFDDISTGASNDLKKAAQIARKMITEYGMSDKLPNLYLNKGESDEGFAALQGQNRSEKLESVIDDETRKIIDNCYNDAIKLIKGKRSLLDDMAQTLLDKETVGQEEIKKIFGEKAGEENKEG